MTVRINVVDAIPGAGKTSWAIQKINEKVDGFGETSNKKYIYVTPFLNEVERVFNCAKANFFEPDSQKGKGSKIKHFKMLVEMGESIVTTHQIFKMIDAETIEDIADEGYTLIMDEVADVIERINVNEDDINYLLNLNAIKIGEMGKIIWLDEDYGSGEGGVPFYSNIKIMAENDTLFIQEDGVFYWVMNIKAFEVFDESYILTYAFDAQEQRYYYDMNNVKYNKYCVQKHGERYELTEYNRSLEPRKELYHLLNVYEGKLNSNYDHREALPKKQQPSGMKNFQLSSRWLNKAPKEDIEQLKKNAYNIFSNVYPTTNKNLYWTTLKSVAPDIVNKKCKINKNKGNFVAFNVRATNNYAHCTSMAYIYNRFMNPNIKKFFTTRNVSVNEDLLAVSDLIQFLFRGCIRKGEPMNCYIPSSRMRKLLKDWSDYKL